MDILEVLLFADELVFAKTGKHLDNLQQAILQGTLEHQKYSEIAEEHHCSLGHVRDIASELWKVLSEELGEDIRKANFSATIERSQLYNVSHKDIKDIVQINNISFCGERTNSLDTTPTEEGKNATSKQNKVRQDLGNAPEANLFYGRTEELATLDKWIIQNHCRLVTILGASGIGKTALGVRFVEQFQDSFDYIIWRSLRHFPPAKDIETQLIQFLDNDTKTNLITSIDSRRNRLLSFLRSHRCLIILDDVQYIFSSGEFAGKYKPNYEDYGSLFRLLGETPHQSCLVLLSDEKPREIRKLEEASPYCQSLKLGGLGVVAKEILRDKGLLEESAWDDLIKTYSGNPCYLLCISAIIQDLFQGSVAQFLSYDSLFLGDDIEAILERQFQRLSPLEKQVISSFATSPEFVSVSQLLHQISLSPSDCFNALQSLKRRSLIEKFTQKNETYFTVSPVVRRYFQ